MSRLREALATELAKKVSQHGLVVWQDDAGEYKDLAKELAPVGAEFVSYDGSWYDLRQQIEGRLAGEDRPTIVVYVPVAAPTEDPLLELRCAAHRFVRRLSTLIEEAYRNELPELRIRRLVKQATSLRAAEAALAAGEEADVRLITVLNTNDLRVMALRILTGERDGQIQEAGAWSAAAEFLSQQFGGAFVGNGDELRRAVARQVLLTEIVAASGSLPDDLRPAWSPVKSDQRGRSLDLLKVWRSEPAARASYVLFAGETDAALGLAERLQWRDGLRDAVSTVGIEMVAQRHVVSLLRDGNWKDAISLAQARQSSWWCRPDVGDDQWAKRASRWRAAEAIALLRLAVADRPAPAGDSIAASDLLAWYADEGWSVDSAHRRYELAKGDLHAYGELEPHIAAARSAYEEWLDATLVAASAAIGAHGLDAGRLARQGDIHETWVRDVKGVVAYVWVDALRYELGRELADNLVGTQAQVEVLAAVAAAPTITPVGMANLSPHASARLAVAVVAGKLVVSLNGELVSTVGDRLKQLRAAHGDQVVDVPLDLAASEGEKDLDRRFRNASVALIRSQELDVLGESGMLQAAWSHFSEVLQILAKLVARLGHAGIRRVVISADHGFVALPRNLGPDRSIDAPSGGTGELHRRVWIGRGASTVPSTLRVPLAATGTRGDVDLIVPRGLAVFKGPGSKQFFHGGLSPQELIVPVVIVDFAERSPSPTLKVQAAVAGDRITTGAFAVKLTFDGDLFTREIRVRAVAQRPIDQAVVARVVSGDGFNAANGLIDLRTDLGPVLAFQVTANLGTGDVVRIDVLDATTGVLLGTTQVEVAAKIVVEDELE